MFSVLAAEMNLFFFFLMYSSHLRIDASMLSSVLLNPLPPSILNTYCVSVQGLGHCHQLSCLLVHLFEFFPCPFYEWFRVSYKGDNPGVYPTNEISAEELDFEKLSALSEVIFSYFFFHLGLFDGIRFQYLQVIVIFFFSGRTDSFLIWLFNSFNYLSFSTFHAELGTFFYAKFHFYIQAVYFYCLYQRLQFFFIFLQTAWCCPYNKSFIVIL